MSAARASRPEGQSEVNAADAAQGQVNAEAAQQGDANAQAAQQAQANSADAAQGQVNAEAAAAQAPDPLPNVVVPEVPTQSPPRPGAGLQGLDEQASAASQAAEAAEVQRLEAEAAAAALLAEKAEADKTARAASEVIQDEAPLVVQLGTKPDDAIFGFSQGRDYGLTTRTVEVEFIPFNAKRPVRIQAYPAGQVVTRTHVDANPLFQPIEAAE